MKKVFKRILIVTLLGICILHTVVNAETLKVTQKELDTTISELEKNGVETNEDKYKVTNITVSEAKDNSKTVEVERTLTDLTTNDEEEIRSLFGETYSYSEEDASYEGILSIDTVEIETLAQEEYETIKSYNIPFEKYSSNDLNDIEKTIVVSGRTYYLINVDWIPDETEIIDKHEVVLSYKGTIHYKTVVKYTEPATYSATAKYVGTVNRVEKEYIVEYNLEKNTANIAIITTTIIISGLGFALILFLVFSKNVKVYNIINGQEKLVKTYRISKDKLRIDLSNLKTLGSNIYIFKLKKSLFKEIKGKELRIKKANGIVTRYPVTDEKFTVSL